ncbi:hypothetical protein [uncultured Ruegeria sp.]|uniref:hypothetical protein n=1 Tax=uncultured Ruegeria sp. TaxID=259304 RepID=UPI0026371762|nr:hypothetical protein [uncultured Ruegeria sp.]
MKPSEYLATLVRGRQYRLRVPSGAQEKFIVFNHGTAVRVSEDLKIQLEKHAVFPVQTKFSTGEVEESYECQFTFEPAD